MSKTIDTERYCWALETWATLPRSTKEDGEEAAIRRICTHLRATMPGVRPIRDLCNAFREQLDKESADDRHIVTDIAKSCLLYRLMYAGEELRTEQCPTHKGRWSGWSFTPCACSFGPNLTGWLP
jgi:hypothetical protein